MSECLTHSLCYAVIFFSIFQFSFGCQIKGEEGGMGESNYPLKIFLLLMPNELMYVENLDMCEREVGSLFLTSIGSSFYLAQLRIKTTTVSLILLLIYEYYVLFILVSYCMN